MYLYRATKRTFLQQLIQLPFRSTIPLIGYYSNAALRLQRIGISWKYTMPVCLASKGMLSFNQANGQDHRLAVIATVSIHFDKLESTGCQQHENEMCYKTQMKLEIRANMQLVFQLGLLALLCSCTTTVNSSKIENTSDNIKAKKGAIPAREKTGMRNDEKIEFAKQDLAQKLKVNMEEIKLLSSRSVTWRSGALGCPKPGVSYTQALQAGTLIVLESKGALYRYHSGRTGNPKHCPSERAQMPISNEADR